MTMRAITLVLMLSIIMVGCSKESTQPPGIQTDVPFTPEGVLDFVRPDSSIINRIVIEIAETPQEQAQGLMYRRSLPDRGGMLFIDQAESMRSFWMKNTALSLDILFVDAQGEIVNIVKRTTPFPRRTFYPLNRPNLWLKSELVSPMLTALPRTIA